MSFLGAFRSGLGNFFLRLKCLRRLCRLIHVSNKNKTKFKRNIDTTTMHQNSNSDSPTSLIAHGTQPKLQKTAKWVRKINTKWGREQTSIRQPDEAADEVYKLRASLPLRRVTFRCPFQRTVAYISSDSSSVRVRRLNKTANHLLSLTLRKKPSIGEIPSITASTDPVTEGDSQDPITPEHKKSAKVKGKVTTQGKSTVPLWLKLW